MANEAVCIESPTKYVRYTIADGASISKGTILQLSSDPNTASASSGANVFAGIAIEDKTASDGITEIGAAIDGTWDLVAAGAITLGGIVSLSGANLVKQASAGELLTGAAFGKCLETASNAETVRVRLGNN